MTTTRRLAAILAADVAGYSRLMAADEAGTLALLKRLRAEAIEPRIAQFHGRIVGSAGDSLLVEFASAVEAVQCAVEAQGALAERNAELPEDRRMAFRMGVNLGDVIAEDEAIHGDGVNVAARLEKLAEPGSVCIGHNVYDQVKAKLAFAYADLGEQRFHNIPEPVRAYRVGPGGDAAMARPALALPDKPSIAVLPFENMSGDPEQEYFADGMTEDITTELSRFKSLLVIARKSSFHYKGRQIKLQDICRELGVAYVVEGSVRKSGERVRVVAQLVEAARGTHLWAERYDRKLDDVFAVQDEITQTIAGALAIRIEEEGAGIARRKPPNDMRAHDYWLRGKKALDLSTLEATEEAHSLFGKVLEISPDYARGFAGLAEATYSRAFFVPLPKPFGDLVDEALAFAERSVALDDTDARPHMVLGWACMFRREFDRARRHFDLSQSLNPNDADLIMHRAGALALLGEADDAIGLANKAIRLNPYHPGWYLEYVSLINFVARRYEAVLATAATSRDAYPSSPAWRAAASAYLGRYEDARRHAEDLIAGLRGRWEGASGASFRDHAAYLCGVIPFKRPEDAEHLLAGLRRADRAG